MKNSRNPGSSFRFNIEGPDGAHTIVPDFGESIDEIVLDDWLHVERMDDTHWWIKLGQVAFNVTVSRSANVASRVVNQETGEELK